MTSPANHLANETSPYLLQHAHNPVNWYPWSAEALDKARAEDKPILVSIGYAACHWCHVMERESFEDEATAEIMNLHFINIKIDREERPDLDHIYMDAVQAMTGSGGWPLNVFLTPDGKPFYGGTYFPPVRSFSRSSWTETILSVSQAFKERRDEIEKQAAGLTGHILQSNSFGTANPEGHSLPSPATLGEITKNILATADKEWGGFGRAPKFPQTFTIQYVLRHFHVSGDREALDQALLSLDKMIDGGIYDQVGGGFARYSTDAEWLAPHFEKMLYDNALLVSVISDAYQLTKEKRYLRVIDETMEYVKRELLHPDQGFYSALDADSEGEEGRFYVWSLEEVERVLADDAPIFCKYYDITATGNWEGKNILRVKQNEDDFARDNRLSKDELQMILSSGRAKLLAERSRRIRPLLDDKIILSWNALMNTACSKAYMATGKQQYMQLAVDNMQFIISSFAVGDNQEFRHTWKGGQAKYPAFLDDYAFLIQAMINLQEITGDRAWLKRAKEMMNHVIDRFSDEESGFFYYTTREQEDVIVRKKEIYDGAIPSGNSVMAYNLHQLGIYFDERGWKERSMKMATSLATLITKYPTSFGIWACLLQELIKGTLEIVIMGKEVTEMKSKLFDQFLPHKVFMTSNIETNEFPLLAGKKTPDIPLIYLCKDFVCQQPVTSIDRFMSLINRR